MHSRTVARLNNLMGSRLSFTFVRFPKSPGFCLFYKRSANGTKGFSPKRNTKKITIIIKPCKKFSHEKTHFSLTYTQNTTTSRQIYDIKTLLSRLAELSFAPAEIPSHVNKKSLTMLYMCASAVVRK